MGFRGDKTFITKTFNMKKSFLNTDWNAVHQAINVIHCVCDENDYAKYNVSIDANRVVIWDCINNLELVSNQHGITMLQMAQIAILEFVVKHEPNLLVGMHKPQYNILIAPSSEDEDRFENCTTYEDAVKIVPDCESASIHEFDTSDERDAFIEGYNAAIGNLGDGYFITNSNNQEA